MRHIFEPHRGNVIAVNYWHPGKMDTAHLVDVGDTWFSIKSPSGRTFSYPYSSVYSTLQPPKPVKAGTSSSQKATVEFLVTMNVPRPSADGGWIAFGISF